jgi:hypothetical protein
VISDLHRNYSNIRVIVISDITDFFKILQDLVEKALKQVAEKKAELEKHLEEKVFFIVTCLLEIRYSSTTVHCNGARVAGGGTESGAGQV